jgi:predicted CxxxxCH...CXXCH cytochrome family protein
MSLPVERHTDHDGYREHRTPRIMRIAIPVLLTFLLVLVSLVLKVPSATTGSLPCDCGSCHVVADTHLAGCTGCHGYPPATGAHRVHFDNTVPQNARYGDTTVSSTAGGYIFGCGNCHPLDSAMHHTGEPLPPTAEVELYNPAAPAGSLKAKNLPTAAYNPVTKTCSDVYCHSGKTVTSGPVGDPLLNLDGSYILDSNGNFTYAPYTVTITRDYKTTSSWGTTGTSTTCTECHGFPTTTAYPAVQAMVGDSHSWWDDWGLVDGHSWNMGSGTGVPCATCHYTSVNHVAGYPTSPPTYLAAGDENIYYPISIKDRSLHVNGSPNIAFDNGYQYNTWNDLNNATYNAQTKTCNNVACHRTQTTVTWGSPYRWWTAECNNCHSY